jgi:predicted HAD superfamily phosphohydrolase
MSENSTKVEGLRVLISSEQKAKIDRLAFILEIPTKEVVKIALDCFFSPMGYYHDKELLKKLQQFISQKDKEELFNVKS